MKGRGSVAGGTELRATALAKEDDMSFFNGSLRWHVGSGCGVGRYCAFRGRRRIIPGLPFIAGNSVEAMTDFGDSKSGHGKGER